MLYLLADEAEAAVLPDALVRLTQHRVEGFVAVPERRRGVTGDREGSDVNLREMKYKKHEIQSEDRTRDDCGTSVQRLQMKNILLENRGAFTEMFINVHCPCKIN